MDNGEPNQSLVSLKDTTQAQKREGRSPCEDKDLGGVKPRNAKLLASTVARSSQEGILL